ncbi:bifunctional endoribonuclease/protein kinase ire1 [Tulasnella sp. 330]|nr:bifunctional endoribonuclease/protein kinase ire1 [Tulasnella sp. 330]
MASVDISFTLSFIILLILSVSAQSIFEARNSVTALQKYETDGLSSPALRPHPLRSDELDLLDTVLLASVDGRFHGLNRTTGRLVWTMEAPSSHPMNLQDLVRTEHTGLRGGTAAVDVDSQEGHHLPFETYIIEPQSGNIFLNPADAKRDDPLQRLPFSMSQLVDMSPFRFDDQRTFVGKKRTSLISLDLRSGEVLEILDPEQCSWGDERHGASRRNVLSKEEELLEELEDPIDRTIVHIGRTDYHVSVFSRGRIIQNLTYSAYGPNNMDKDVQYLWHRTPDNRYHQPTPDGNLIMFKTDEKDPLRYMMKFKRPIVAVFDAVTFSDRSDPLLLLQPTPSLQDLYPSQRKEVSDLSLNGEVTYVGRIGNSLYALSHQTYPHVLFSQFPSQRTIESDATYNYLYDTDEFGEPLEGCTTLDCLVGAHYTETASPSRLSRLIASVASIPAPSVSILKEIQRNPPSPEMTHDQHHEVKVNIPEPSIIATSSSPPVAGATPRKSTIPMYTLDPPQSAVKFWTIGSDSKNPLLGGLVGLLLMAWMIAKWVSGHWGNKKQLSEIADRDMGFEPVVLPPLKVEHRSAETPSDETTPTHPRDLSIDTELKPLPPVPPPETLVEPPPSPGADRRSSEETPDGDGDGADTEKEAAGEGGNGAKRGKGKPLRRKRGKGGGGGGSRKVTIMDPLGKEDGETSRVVFTHALAQPAANASAVRAASSLVVSDTVLGYGSHGTMVFQGTFQGRAVAVKRLLQDFVTLASREVTLLQESDDHPNVIRYYFKENRDNFLYIALELCPASLADIVERPHLHSDISGSFDPKRALSQVTMGLKHLHSLKIVHRDIKPQNILVSGVGSSGHHRMLISDFGLCRKLESDQTSFLPTVHSGGGGMAAGTVGWRAPEILKGEVKLDESTLDMSSGGTPNSSVGGTGSVDGSTGRAGSYSQNRLTKGVDVFALGCLFYYTLTGGEHPYGERFEREVNILKDVKSLDRLLPLGEEGTEAEDLITMMLAPEPKSRPDTTACLIHPFFWSPARRLGFLQDASDRFEIMGRDPPEPQLVALETNARDVVGTDWHKKLDRVFDENLGKFRKYDGKSVQDLMRALRNKVGSAESTVVCWLDGGLTGTPHQYQKHHYQDLPDNVKRSLGVLPEGFLSYFTRRFPRFFLHVYDVVCNDSLLRQDPMFRTYFELAE